MSKRKTTMHLFPPLSPDDDKTVFTAPRGGITWWAQKARHWAAQKEDEELDEIKQDLRDEQAEREDYVQPPPVIATPVSNAPAMSWHAASQQGKIDAYQEALDAQERRLDRAARLKQKRIHEASKRKAINTAKNVFLVSLATWAAIVIIPNVIAALVFLFVYLSNK